MARLIDADVLLQEIEESANAIEIQIHLGKCNENVAKGMLSGLALVRENILRKPTAYDVDAVVDALWDEQLDARQLMNEGKEWGAGCYSGLQIAIETIREFEKAGDNNENNN